MYEYGLKKNEERMSKEKKVKIKSGREKKERNNDYSRQKDSKGKLVSGRRLSPYSQKDRWLLINVT